VAKNVAHPASARDALTLSEVARVVGICERTVRSDSAAGKLKSFLSPDGRRLVRRGDLAGYRAYGSGPHLWKPRDVADRMSISLRTVRRRIARKKYVVVVISPRDLRIDAARTIVQLSDGTEVTMAQYAADLQAEHQEAQRAHNRERRRRRQLIWNGVHFLVRRLRGSATGRDLMFSPPSLARLYGRPTIAVRRQLSKHRDELNRRVAVHLDRFGRRRIWIRWTYALANAERPDAQAEIIWLVVNRFFGEFDPGLRSAILLAFGAWLNAHPDEIRFAKW